MENREAEMNLSIVLETTILRGNSFLHIACSSLYQVFVNGTFVAEGPARAGHGFYRADEIPLHCEKAKNSVRIITVGYNINSFYLAEGLSFVCAEIISMGGDCLAATGSDGFTARVYTERIQKAQRYSFQRTFVEAYSLPSETIPVKLVTTGKKLFIEREVPYPDYTRAVPERQIVKGSFYKTDDYTRFADRALDDIGEKLRGYRKEELEVVVSDQAGSLQCSGRPCNESASEIVLCQNRFSICEFEREETGFLDFDIETSGGRLIITFDEIIRDNDINFTRLSCCNAILIDLSSGKYHFTGFEPNSMKYVKFASDADKTVITRVALIRYEYPDSKMTPPPDFKEEKLNRIYSAAAATFRQNTLDIFMDCPHRERAGWLCDSFFTSRVEHALTGANIVEKCFFDNFLMEDRFKYLPDGMLPMCYPSDHPDGVYIPNWAMWFVIELEERLYRTGDSDTVRQAKERVYGLLSFLRKYENRDGLLEKLDSWIFVEWSKCNSFVQDINYPTNMLYCRFKRAISALYDDSEIGIEADRLAETIRKKSFNGKWFCDNSLYRDGVPILSGECTETCQYYAFYMGIATPETYPDLWKTLVSDFGPERKKNNKYPNIYFSNAFIGNYLRLDLLCRAKMFDRLIENIKGYFGYMAEKTGTLWENEGDYASCNHGFASHVAVWMTEYLKSRQGTDK